MSKKRELRFQFYLPDTRTGREAARLIRENVRDRCGGRWAAELILGHFDPDYAPDTGSYEKGNVIPDTVSERQRDSRNDNKDRAGEGLGMFGMVVPDTVSGTAGAPPERTAPPDPDGEKDGAWDDGRDTAGSSRNSTNFLSALSGMVDLGEEDDI